MCLGIGGCGKTTFVRQMKVLHNIPWEEAELERYASTIRRVFTLAQIDIVWAAKKLNLEFSEESKGLIEKLNELHKDREKSGLSPDSLPLLKSLWEDPISQEIVKKHPEMIGAIHISYFWQNVDRIIKDDYKPLEEDILRVRIRTAGAYSTVICIEKNYFEFFDVGGQKPERSKWEKVLQSHEFSCILFFVACDEWDVMDEEKEYNYSKLEIGKIIFNEVLESNDVPEDIPIILFMNRSDMFQARFEKDESWESYKTTYPDYKGERNYKDGINHIIKIFLDDAPKRKHPVRHYITNSLDKNSMAPVWKAVKEFVMQKAINAVGI
uniref:Uncharacterized protein n=1 Tax=Arcella intermedia TaxID=1963864 RepID=A0A6B2L9N1_9EUKA